MATPPCAMVSARTLRLRLAHWLFLVFAAYLALPLYDVPLWGISLSAPVLLFVAVEVATGQIRVSFARHQQWLVLAGLFWLGCAASLVGNQIWGSQRAIVAAETIMLVRWGYWMVAFAVTVALCSNREFRSRVCVALGLGVIVLAALRIGEAVLLGRWSHEDSRLLSPNAYGWQFSAFAPYALALPAVLKGDRRRLCLAGAAVLALAWVVNGSRGSWVALSAGMALFIGLCSLNPRAFRRYGSGLAVTLALAGGTIWFGRGAWVAAVAERARSFEELEYDKSYATRQVMIEKGLKLFSESPVFGAGVSRFRSTRAELERPWLLRSLGQESLNVKSSHNSYISVLAETGLAGAVPLAMLLVGLGVRGLRTAVRAARMGDIWPVAIFVSFVSMSLHLWVLSGLTGTAPWFIYGLVAATTARVEAVRAVRVTAVRSLGHQWRGYRGASVCG